MEVTRFIAKLSVVVATVGATATAVEAKSNEYNFNTCKYNFYNNVDPFSRQSKTAPVVTTNNGIGQVGASAEQMRTSIGASVYSQTPQRTITIQNRRPVQIVNRNYQVQQQQPVGYYYQPGQNNSAQNTQGGVGYQFTAGGAATYDSASNSATTTNTNNYRAK